MNKQDYFIYNLPKIDSQIINNDKKYQVIGHGVGVDISIVKGELPLNDMDRKILKYIENGGEQLNIHLDQKFEFAEDKPYNCDDNCAPLEFNISNYIDEVINNIDVFSQNYERKWSKEYLLGFYRPFHFYEEWGIFIKATGQANYTLELKRRIAENRDKFGEPSLDACYLISKTFTYFHEFYHHKIESLAYRFEMITREPYYTKGFHCLYCNTFNTNRCLEEAFAHTFAYFETCNKLRPYLSNMGISAKQLRYILKELKIRNSPPGYNLAEKIISANNETEARNFEFHFFEVVLRYCHKLNTGNDLSEIPDILFWKNFKHATHPILFTNNEVTYVIDVDDISKIQVRDILVP